MVDKLEGETVSLTSKLSETEKSLSELETLFKSSEELCENLKNEKAELKKVWNLSLNYILIIISFV